MNESSSSILSKSWKPLALLQVHLFVVLLLLSYFVPAGQEVWRSVDRAVFFLLNGSLNGPGLWEQFWAWANTRYFDALTAFFIILFLIHPIGGFRNNHLQSAIFLFTSMMLCLMTFRAGFHFFCDWMELKVMSPSLVLSPSVRLSAIYPDIPLKDCSFSSFPADHAAVLLATAVFFVANGSGWRSRLAAFFSILAVLPRLVSGAHWISDQLVGGLTVAITTVGWTFFSPYIGWLAKLISMVSQPLINRLAGWPWFRNQHFFLKSAQ